MGTDFKPKFTETVKNSFTEQGLLSPSRNDFTDSIRKSQIKGDESNAVLENTLHKKDTVR